MKHFTELDGLSNKEIEKIIDDWIKNERNRKILKRRLIDHICFERLAEEIDLSVRQTKNIVYKAETQLMQHIS